MGTAQQLIYEMPKMIVQCSRSLFVRFKIVVIWNVKDLLSYEFVSRCFVVTFDIHFIYEVYDHMRWITDGGYVYRVLLSKKRRLVPCLKFVLSHSVLLVGYVHSITFRVYLLLQN